MCNVCLKEKTELSIKSSEHKHRAPFSPNAVLQIVSHTDRVKSLWPVAECEGVCAADICPPPTENAASAPDGAAGGETLTET